MRALLWASRIFIFLFLFAFAIKNTDPVSVRFFFDAAWQAPLVIVVLAFFAGGAVLGALSLLGTIFGLRREATKLRRELKLAQATVSINQAASSPTRNPSTQ
jgi:putative membrane protein